MVNIQDRFDDAKFFRTVRDLRCVVRRCLLSLVRLALSRQERLR